tara:strand:+ start:931 stop:2025 length:1095 start_codon:yes stop_codon:yes gene_type:complete
MKDSDNPYLIQGKKTKKDQGPKKKMFGYRVLGFGGGSLPDEYIAATGGSVSTVDTNFKVHVFTGPGTFCVTAGRGDLAKVDYLVVAGGGGGQGPMAGGGGGGGFRESHEVPVSGPYTASPLAATSCASLPVESPVPVTVGGGGNPWFLTNAPSPTTSPNGQGQNSVFSTITSAGGGGVPQEGGSGAGGGRTTNSGGPGNVPPTNPSQGNPGGGNGGGNANDNGAGGGGGAGGAGQQIPSSVPYPGIHGGDGGPGATTSITGSPVTRAGGGGGGNRQQGTAQPNGAFGAGGPGGGGRSAYTTGSGSGQVVVAQQGQANTGGGGGAPVYASANPPGPHVGNPQTDREQQGGAGGSGVVVIRYRFQA